MAPTQVQNANNPPVNTRPTPHPVAVSLRERELAPGQPRSQGQDTQVAGKWELVWEAVEIDSDQRQEIESVVRRSPSGFYSITGRPCTWWGARAGGGTDRSSQPLNPHVLRSGGRIDGATRCTTTKDALIRGIDVWRLPPASYYMSKITPFISLNELGRRNIVVCSRAPTVIKMLGYDTLSISMGSEPNTPPAFFTHRGIIQQASLGVKDDSKVNDSLRNEGIDALLSC